MKRTLWSVSDLVKHVFPSTYLLDPILPRGGVALVHGKRAIGKTHFALTLAVCLTEGGTLFGRYRSRQSNVVYIQADMGEAMQQKRVISVVQTHKLEGLHFAFPDFISLPHLDENDELVKAVHSVHPGCIIWDTLRQIHRLDMNSDETPAWIYGTAKHLFPGVTHIFIHHDKKTVVDEAELDPEESFRGSGAWLDNADMGIKLREVGTGKLHLDFTKIRTCGPQPGLALSLNTETMLLYAMGEPVDPLVRRWRQQHPNSRPQDLEKYLMSSFVAPPRTIRAIVYGSGSADRNGESGPGPEIGVTGPGPDYPEQDTT